MGNYNFLRKNRYGKAHGPRAHGPRMRRHHAAVPTHAQASPKNKVDQSFTGKNKRRGLSARPRRLAIETPSLGSRGAIATSPVQALACSPDPAPANMPATFSDTQPNIAPTIIEMMMTTTGFSMEIAVRLPAPLPSNVKATTEAKP